MLWSTVITVCILFISTSIGRDKEEIPDIDYNYLLSENVIPTRYILKFSPNLANRTFKGQVEIEIKVLKIVNNIIFHMKNLYIPTGSCVFLANKYTRSRSENSVLRHTSEYLKRIEDIHVLDFGGVIAPGEYIITIPEYEGYFKDSESADALNGFYRGKYIDERGEIKYFGSTLTAPIYAREFFPCFDEPKLKAKFKISIIRPAEYNSISNGLKVNSSNLGRHVGYMDDYEETEVMSTYSIAIIVSQFMTTEDTSTNNNIHKAAGEPKYIKANRGRFATDEAKKIDEALQSFLYSKHTLKKVYHVGLPSEYIKNDAMYGWSTITYRDKYVLLFNNNEAADTENTYLLIARQIAHHWFGSLISLYWWDYTWLNEGIAMFMSFRIVEEMKPEWKVSERFLGQIQCVMHEDSHGGSPSLNEAVLNSSDIELKYNRISSYKGASLLRMLESILGTDYFRRGLQLYIQNRQYKTAKPHELYSDLAKEASSVVSTFPRELDGIMSTWDGLDGYPVVHVERKYPHLYLKQQKHLASNPKGKFPVWCIPINYATKRKNDFEDTRPTHWLEYESTQINIKDVNDKDWIIVNKKQAYYYRVNYDIKNWKLLVQALQENHKQIHELNRMQLIDDSFEFANIGLISYEIPFNIISYLKNEKKYGPFYSLRQVYSLMLIRLQGTETAEKFKIHIKNCIKTAYDYLKIKHGSHNLGHNEQLTLHFLSEWFCEMEKGNCMASDRRTESNRADADRFKLCQDMSLASTQKWKQMLRKFDSNKKIFFALGCTRKPELLKLYFNYIISLENHTKGLLSVAMQAATNQGQLGIEEAISFIKNNLKKVVKQEGQRETLNSVTYLGSKIVTKKHYQMLLSASEKHQKYYKIFKTALMLSKRNIEWIHKRELEFRNTFQNISLLQRTNEISKANESRTIEHLLFSIFIFAWNYFIIKIIH